MAEQAARNARKIPGRLCRDPTDLSLPFPHGGVALGSVRDHRWRVRQYGAIVRAEEWGNTPVEAIYNGEEGVLACVAREFDSDFLSAMFVDTDVGAGTGRRRVLGRVLEQGKRAGKRLTDMATAIYFSPDSELDHGIYLYRAIPMVDRAAEINYQTGTEMGILCLWISAPDADGNRYVKAPRKDIVLP